MTMLNALASGLTFKNHISCVVMCPMSNTAVWCRYCAWQASGNTRTPQPLPPPNAAARAASACRALSAASAALRAAAAASLRPAEQRLLHSLRSRRSWLLTQQVWVSQGARGLWRSDRWFRAGSCPAVVGATEAKAWCGDRCCRTADVGGSWGWCGVGAGPGDVGRTCNRQYKCSKGDCRCLAHAAASALSHRVSNTLHVGVIIAQVVVCGADGSCRHGHKMAGCVLPCTIA